MLLSPHAALYLYISTGAKAMIQNNVMTITLQISTNKNLQYQKSYLLLQVKKTGFGNK